MQLEIGRSRYETVMGMATSKNEKTASRGKTVHPVVTAQHSHIDPYCATDAVIQ
ncbi:MAG TPA: hypothetical protein VIR13_03475 [Savagea sp.]